MIRKVLIGSLLVATFAIVLVSIALYKAWSDASSKLTTEQLRFFLDAYKAIGVGFLVALLGAIIPQLLPEARDRFERFKDSRVAYSEAKTSVIYLPDKLSDLSISDAAKVVQDAHKKLHLAETYTELKNHLKWHPHPEFWVAYNYWELMAIQKALRKNVNKWNSLSTEVRLNILLDALKIVDKVFGPYCEQWVKMSPVEREQKIEDELNSMVEIFTTINLPEKPSYIAPDGTELRLLTKTKSGEIAHGSLSPKAVSSAVKHKSVDEIWYFVSGKGQVWRKQGVQEEIVDAKPGTCLTIPVGTHFQFRNTGEEPLCFVIATIPPWPGPDEAVRLNDYWNVA